MSESARGEGGRVWVPRKKGDTRPPSQIPEKERLYFLEEKYPAYGNLVPRDIATREIFQICLEGLGVALRLAAACTLSVVASCSSGPTTVNTGQTKSVPSRPSGGSSTTGVVPARPVEDGALVAQVFRIGSYTSTVERTPFKLPPTA